jgi:hypothetical protein
MRKGWPVASDLMSFFTHASWGMSSSQPRKVTAKACCTVSLMDAVLEEFVAGI